MTVFFIPIRISLDAAIWDRALGAPGEEAPGATPPLGQSCPFLVEWISRTGPWKVLWPHSATGSRQRGLGHGTKSAQCSASVWPGMVRPPSSSPRPFPGLSPAHWHSPHSPAGALAAGSSQVRVVMAVSASQAGACPPPFRAHQSRPWPGCCWGQDRRWPSWLPPVPAICRPPSHTKTSAPHRPLLRNPVNHRPPTAPSAGYLGASR